MHHIKTFRFSTLGSPGLPGSPGAQGPRGPEGNCSNTCEGEIKELLPRAPSDTTHLWYRVQVKSVKL